MRDLHRRRTLQLFASGAGMTALAGCSTSSDDENGENGEAEDDLTGDLPSYASLLPEIDGADYFYGAIDLPTMTALVNHDDVESGDEPTDPLLGNPVLVAFLCSFGFTQVSTSPSVEAFAANDETDGDQTLVFVDGVYAFSGRYNVDGFRADLPDAGYTVERDEAEYAVYTHPDAVDVVGISDEAFVFGQRGDDARDAIEAVERTVATAAGDREPAHETDPEFERLLRAGSTDGIALGLYTTEDEFAAETLADDQPEDDADDLRYEFEPFAGARGVHQGLSLPDVDGRATARAVVDYSDDDRVDEALLESRLGTDADSVSFDRVETTVMVTAEYDDGVSE